MSLLNPQLLTLTPQLLLTQVPPSYKREAKMQALDK